MIIIEAERGTEVFGRTRNAKQLVFVGWAMKMGKMENGEAGKAQL